MGQTWGLTLVIPALWEAEAGGTLERSKWRLQWAEITPLYSSLGDTVTAAAWVLPMWAEG